MSVACLTSPGTSKRAPRRKRTRRRGKKVGGVGAYQSGNDNGKEEHESRTPPLPKRWLAAIAEDKPRVDDVAMTVAMLPNAQSIGSTPSTTELLSTGSMLGTGRHRRLAERGSEDLLGEGAFAYVKKGSLLSRNRQSETPAAIKKNDEEEDASHEVSIMRALQLPGGLPHPHIVHFYGYTREKVPEGHTPRKVPLTKKLPQEKLSQIPSLQQP